MAIEKPKLFVMVSPSLRRRLGIHEKNE